MLLTDFAFINIFHGIKIPIPWRTKIKYTIFHLEKKYICIYILYVINLVSLQYYKLYDTYRAGYVFRPISTFI